MGETARRRDGECELDLGIAVRASRRAVETAERSDGECERREQDYAAEARRCDGECEARLTSLVRPADREWERQEDVMESAR